MKVILIHAHKNLALLNDLIDVLSTENHAIYVNVDLKSTIDVRNINKKARLVRRRIRVHWGKFSQVSATINSLIEIDEREKNYEHVVFISGQDFPVVSNDVIDSYLVPGREYIDNVAICENGWAVNDRYEKYNFGYSRSRQIIALLVNSIAAKTIEKRRMPSNYESYGGSQWWMLTNECVKYILSFIRHNRRFVNFFRYVGYSDEIFFHTVVMNSTFKNNVVNRNFRYIDWTDSKDGSPKILGVEDYENIVSSGNLFCRKVEYPYSAPLIEKLIENFNCYQ
jgi:hypothetical protein